MIKSNSLWYRSICKNKNKLTSREISSRYIGFFLTMLGCSVSIPVIAIYFMDKTANSSVDNSYELAQLITYIMLYIFIFYPIFYFLGEKAVQIADIIKRYFR